jgi:hypothetical protein
MNVGMNTMKEKSMLHNEDGSVLILALVMLALLLIIGISATTTSDIENLVARNLENYNISFYTAEAGTAFVAETPSLYGSNNITKGESLSFPNNANPSEKYALSSTQSFNGDVEYLGFSAPPRGSGYDAEKFKAHRYKMTSSGYGPLNAQSTIELGFYRIGL